MGTDGKSRSFAKVLRWSLALSLLFHLVVIGIKNNDLNRSENTPSGEKQRPRRITVKLKENLPKLKRSKKHQIVDSEKTAPTQEPVDTRFLSEQTQRVDRQSIAKSVDPFKKAGKGQEDGHLTGNQDPTSGEKKKSKKELLKSKKNISLSDLAPSVNKASSNAALGEKFGEENKTGRASTNDYIDDVPLGDMTKLNTVEFKYYGFYHRIKQKLEQYWGHAVRKEVIKLLKKGRRPASMRTKNVTSLAIILNSKGSIIDIKVKTASGIRELDEAAIESFNKAGPFPNPPEGMIKNGTARIEWGFIVKS